MEIKVKLDTKKSLKAAVAIAAAYGLCCAFKGTKSPQLAAANTLALIVIVTILYGPRPVPHKKHLNRHDTQPNHAPCQGGTQGVSPL
jgi:hypothetical protein